MEDFNSETGIAFTKLTHSTWQSGPGGGGFSGQDKATFLSNWNNDVSFDYKQSMTIGNSKSWMWPFHGKNFGYSSFALVFSLREEDEYWKYFWTSPADCHGTGAPLMASCSDCVGRCCGKLTGSQLVGDSLSYAQWAHKKNAVVQETGTGSCYLKLNRANRMEQDGDIHWNEFNSNGLSPDALVGVLNDLTTMDDHSRFSGGESQPNMQDVCNFLAAVNKLRRSPLNSAWPIFNYQSQSRSATLTLAGHVDCSAGSNMTVILV